MSTVTMTKQFSGTVERDGERVPFDVLPGDDWTAADLRTNDGLIDLTPEEWEQVPAFAEWRREQDYAADVAEYGWDAVRFAAFREQ